MELSAEDIDAARKEMWGTFLRDEVARAVGRVLRDEVPDMPDRIIAATALYFGVPVMSRDGKIQTSAVPAIW